MDNFWPNVDDIKNTTDVMPFFELTIEMLKQKYDGKINAQICKIEFIFKRIQGAFSVLDNISKFVGPQNDKDTSGTYEEKLDIEKDRKQAYICNSDYKYEIYNDHLYYKLFTINIPEFYPINIHISAGILENDDVEKEINDLDELKRTFSEIVRSDKVRMIIHKMME